MNLEKNKLPEFNYCDYKGKEQFSTKIKVGESFIFNTIDIYHNNEVSIKLIKTETKHKACIQCPLMQYECGGIECNCIINKTNKK